MICKFILKASVLSPESNKNQIQITSRQACLLVCQNTQHDLRLCLFIVQVMSLIKCLECHKSPGLLFEGFSEWNCICQWRFDALNSSVDKLEQFNLKGKSEAHCIMIKRWEVFWSLWSWWGWSPSDFGLGNLTRLVKMVTLLLQLPLLLTLMLPREALSCKTEPTSMKNNHKE